MATNENVIGVEAQLNISQFEAASKKLDKMIADLDKNIDNFTKQQTKSAAEAEKAAQKQAAAQEKAAKEAEKAVERQGKAINRAVSSFRSAAFLVTATVAGIILSYKQLAEAAGRLGDAEAVAQFEAIDKAGQGLADTFAVMALEINKAAGILPLFTGVLETARQLIAITGRELVFLTTLMAGMRNLPTAGMGIEDLGRPENQAKLQQANAMSADLVARATQKANEAFMGMVNAPQQAEAYSQQQKNLKDAFDAQAKYGEKYHDLQIKTGESILEAEKTYHDKSADAWRDYMATTAEIVTDGIKERAKIQQRYSDKVAEAERDYQRGIEKASIDHDSKMADIERDYQDEIRNIQNQYKEDALDAIRNLDAIALIRAREKRDKDMAAARQDRDRSMSDEERDYQRSLGELIRALQDKKQEADESRRRDLEEQRRNEQEKTQAAKDAYNQQLVDAQIAFNNKIAAIRGQYSQEDAEAQAHYLNQENQLVAHLNAMAAITARYGIGTGGESVNPIIRGGMRRRQEGGIDIVNTPTQFLAGEAGPEIAAFIPLNRAIPAPTIQTVNHVGDFQHSLDASISSSVAGLDGRIMAAVRKALGEVLR